jgi:hypothetical protein
MRAWIGRRAAVFVEEARTKPEGWLKGRSTCGLPVSLPAPADGAYVLGRTLEVAIGEASAFGLSGRAALPAL